MDIDLTDPKIYEHGVLTKAENESSIMVHQRKGKNLEVLSSIDTQITDIAVRIKRMIIETKDGHSNLDSYMYIAYKEAIDLKTTLSSLKYRMEKGQVCEWPDGVAKPAFDFFNKRENPKTKEEK